MKILIIDNYDSFTYNLVHYFEGFNVEVKVMLNDQIQFSEINDFDKIVLSPGPGLPKDAGDLNKLIDLVIQTKHILGVCLGFQAIAEYFGGELYNQNKVKHGVSEYCVFKNNTTLFKNTPIKYKVGLYHSWAAKKINFPKNLSITAESEHGIIMGFEHQTLPIYGVQFHPESILTENGHQIFKNFLAV